jgi:hypothetical protein
VRLQDVKRKACISAELHRSRESASLHTRVNNVLTRFVGSALYTSETMSVEVYTRLEGRARRWSRRMGLSHKRVVLRLWSVTYTR